MRDEYIALEYKFEVEHEETQSLQHALCNTNEIIDELKLENSCLLTQLTESHPLYSTPLRDQAPSLHDELGIAHEISSSSLNDLMDSLSEVEGDNLVFKDALSLSVSLLTLHN